MDKIALYNRIKNLSSSQRQLLSEQLKQFKKEGKEEGRKERLQLRAYVQGNSGIDSSNLKNYLKERLPDYMVPAHIFLVDDFPRLPNGKIDQKSLPNFYKLNSDESSGYVEANSEIEQKLVTIWEGILDFVPIGIHDNFFEIGGDSILSIQIVSKARQQGIILAANQLFEHQTISELALFAQTEVAKSDTKVIIKTGKTRLTPIQEWFFETHQIAPQFWNQAIQFTPKIKIENAVVEKSIGMLIERHDALRLGFHKNDDKWEATLEKIEKLTPFKQYTLDDNYPNESINDILYSEQAEFNLSTPNLFRCLYLEINSNTQNIIIFIVNHLLIDAVSWNILLADFWNICEGLMMNKTIKPLPIPNSFASWSERLMQFAIKQAREDYAFWIEQTVIPFQLPSDFQVEMPIEEENVIAHTLILNESIATQLLKNTSAAYNTKTEDLLILALLLTIQNWTEKNQISLGFEKHGREEIGGIDVSTTIGWFTAYFPLMFDLEDSTEIGSQIKMVKEKLRNVPNGGISYGALRYLENDAVKKDDLKYQVPIVFNYLGHMHSEINDFGEIKIINKNLRHPKSERYYSLEINCYFLNNQLEIVWSFGQNYFKPETISKQLVIFENYLKSIINHCVQVKNIEHTPSDFPDAGLDQDDLDSLMNLFE